MSVSILNERAIKKSKSSYIYKIIASLLGVFTFFSLFFSNIKYVLNEYVYLVSAIEIIKDKGLFFEGRIIKFPVSMKIFFFLSLIFLLMGISTLIADKIKISTICFMISSVCVIGSMLFSSCMDFNIDKVSIKFLTPLILAFIFALLSAGFAALIESREKVAAIVFFLASCVSVGFVILITLYMLISGLPAIYEIGLFKFIMGETWEPSKNLYGVLPLILSSFAGTFGAIIIGVPIGILTAVFLAEIAPIKVANILRPLIQLLAGIPSVVYGFFGMLVIVPFIRKIFGPLTVGDSLLAVILILSIMILPTVITITESSLRAVPLSYREASLSLGATPINTVFKITVPAARSGILSAVILGVGRAIGETMAVIMVAGNVVNMPSILGSVRLLTTGIVLEMSYSSGLHRQALFAIGLILFVFIMIVNISFAFISKRSEPGVKN